MSVTSTPDAPRNRQLTPARAQRRLPHPAGLEAGGDRLCRAALQLPADHRRVRRVFRRLRPLRLRTHGGARCGRTARPPRPVSSRATVSSPSTARGSRPSPMSSAIVSGRAGDELAFVMLRDGQEIELTATPELTEQKDALGNTVKVGVIGVVNNEELGQPRLITYSPAGRLGEAVTRDRPHHRAHRTFPAALRVGREDKCQLGGPVKIADMAGQAAKLGLRVAGPACGAFVGGHRLPQPLADSPARRRASGLLRRRGRSSAARFRNGRWKWSTGSGFCWCSASWGSCSGTICLDAEFVKKSGLENDPN